ncbi:MAG: ClpXP protease specificity-enhancing factor SspB [Pseudomonadota bacterium]
MTAGSIPYAQLVESALIGVVRDVLDDASRQALEPPHHFYITFRTDHPGVEMPEMLRQRYAPEMTIVLQHQFWDLDVGPDRFGVTLSFGGRPQRLSIPFAAVKVFADPGVEFGLQFTLADREADGADSADGRPVLLPTLGPGADGQQDEPEDPTDPTDPDPDPKGGAAIVTLDRFRKR